MKKQLAALATAAVGVALLAAGCSAPDPVTEHTKPAGSPDSRVQEETYNECIDGRATVLVSDIERGGKISLGDCTEVSVVGAAAPGSSVELGTVGLLVIEADGATIRSGKVDRIVIPGAKNTVTYAGKATVDDQGTDNTVTAS